MFGRRKKADLKPLPPKPKDRFLGPVFRSSVATFLGFNGPRTEELWRKLRREGGEIYLLANVRLPGALVRRAFPGRSGQMVLLMSPRAMREFWTSSGDAIDQETAKEFMSFIMGSSSILLQSGQKHRRLRHAMTPVLTKTAVESYRQTIADVIDDHIDRLPLGEPIKFQEMLVAANLEVILRTGFGLDDADELARWESIVRESMNMTMSSEGFRRIAASLITGQPIRRVWPRAAALLDNLDQLIFDLIGKLRRRDDDGADLTSRLLRVADDEGNPLTDKEIRDQGVTMALAGHETTATATAWALERLVRYPDVYNKLAAEAQLATSDEYVTAVTRETLRLRSSIGGIGAQTKEELEVCGYRIPAGTAIAMPLGALHRDPQIYPDPERFNPERFLEGQQYDFFAWMPFGAGRHRCIGMHLAMLEINIALSRIVGRLELEPVDPADEGQVVRVFITAPDRGSEMVIKSRKPASEVPLYDPKGCPVDHSAALVDSTEQPAT